MEWKNKTWVYDVIFTAAVVVYKIYKQEHFSINHDGVEKQDMFMRRNIQQQQ